MTNINSTEQEKKVLNVLIETEQHYISNGEPGFSDVDLEQIVGETELPVKTVRGVLGSLIKKDLVFTMDVNGDYNIYYLTSRAREYFGVERGE